MNQSWTRRGFLGTTGAVLASSCFQTSMAQPKSSQQTEWWSWRGPNGNATSPEKISDSLEKEKMLWATPVPGRGHSSPTVAQGKIYLQTADKSAQTQSVLAFQQSDGKPLWSKIVHSGGLDHKNHVKNTEASPTVAFDGTRLFAVFHNANAVHLTALSPEGEILYQKNLGQYMPKLYEYGYAPSPTIYQNLVIVSAEYEKGGFLVGLERSNGKEVWRTTRPNNYSFSSPIVAHVAGRDQLVMSGANQIASYEPLTGRQIWSVPGTTAATCGTVVWDDKRVFASGGYPKPGTYCVEADGTGKVLWSNPQKCYEQSMLATGGYLYAVTDQGIAYCWRATDGQEMWKERLAGPISSSPTLANDVIHVFNEAGEHFAFKANSERFELLAREQIATDIFSSPSIVNGVMYLRVANKGANGIRQEYLAALT